MKRKPQDPAARVGTRLRRAAPRVGDKVEEMLQPDVASESPDEPATGFTVFLDRDGVFDVHPPAMIRDWKQFRWLPGVQDAFARLNRDDVRTCLCTNQPFVGLGMLSRRRLQTIHERMVEELEAAGGRMDHLEAAYAPYFVLSRRRKPGPGMLEAGAAALERHGWSVDKQRAVMVGDKPKDAMAGNAFGVPAILLATTYGEEALERAIAQHRLDAVVVSGLPAAVDVILERLERHG